MKPIRAYLKLESTAGIILFAMAILALILENSPFAYLYQAIQQWPIQVNFAEWSFVAPLPFWINEGLMTFFFLLVGLELKREFLTGVFVDRKQIILPGIAALGGMLVPVGIFILLNSSHPDALKGWAIPVATDIAFALGVLSLFGRRVPLGLKLFLMALAIFDDVGAILIIAISHTGTLSFMMLIFACVLFFILWGFNILGVTRLWPYLTVGFLLWLCVLNSGVHATVAGVLLALLIPIHEKKSPLHRLEKILHPCVAYFVMPLFAFINAGVSFIGAPLASLFDYLTLGIICGLVIGKQLGVFGFVLTLIKLGWAKLPEGTTWLQLYGVAVLCGIGFTMSLFLGTLAFENDNPIYLIKVRLGVLLGSLLSGVIGAAILHIAFVTRKKRARD